MQTMRGISGRFSYTSEDNKNILLTRNTKNSLHKIENRIRRSGFVQKKSLLLRCVNPVLAVFTLPGKLLAGALQLAGRVATFMGNNNSCTLSDEIQREESRILHNGDYSSENVQIVKKIISCKSNACANTQCLSCLEDRPATSMCPVCAKFLPSQFNFSCIKCKKTKPLVTMCMKYHGHEPKLRMCPCRKCNNVQPVGDYADFEVSNTKVRRNETVRLSSSHLLQQMPHGYRLRDTVARRERHHFRRYYRHRRRIYSDYDSRY